MKFSTITKKATLALIGAAFVLPAMNSAHAASFVIPSQGPSQGVAATTPHDMMQSGKGQMASDTQQLSNQSANQTANQTALEKSMTDEPAGAEKMSSMDDGHGKAKVEKTRLEELLIAVAETEKLSRDQIMRLNQYRDAEQFGHLPSFNAEKVLGNQLRDTIKNNAVVVAPYDGKSKSGGQNLHLYFDNGDFYDFSLDGASYIYKKGTWEIHRNKVCKDLLGEKPSCVTLYEDDDGIFSLKRSGPVNNLHAWGNFLPLD